MDSLDDLALVVGLEAFDLDVELGGERTERGVNVGQRRRAVRARVALAEHVEVDAVQAEHLGARLLLLLLRRRRLRTGWRRGWRRRVGSWVGRGRGQPRAGR